MGKKTRSNNNNKVAIVMREFREHKLHSGSRNGPLVTDPRQARAIALSEQRRYGIKKRARK